MYVIRQPDRSVTDVTFTAQLSVREPATKIINTFDGKDLIVSSLRLNEERLEMAMGGGVRE
jgi:hypothetical protein